MRISIVTVSDSSSQGKREDKSGPLLVELARNSDKIVASVSDPLVIPDDKPTISETILKLCAESDVIITTGGTGWAPRDVTPEATADVMERRCGGLEVALHVRSLQSTPFAALSRLSAGIRGSTIIVNFPGSTKAVKECWEVLEPLLNHGVGLLTDVDQEAVHANIQKSV